MADVSSPLFPKIESTINATLMLTDDSGAFTLYILNCEIHSSNTVNFKQIENIEIDESKSIQIPLDIGDVNFIAKFCGTQEIIKWIWYSKYQKLLFINNNIQWKFRSSNNCVNIV